MMQNIQSFALAGVFAVATAVSASAATIDVINAPDAWTAAGNGANSTTLQSDAYWVTSISGTLLKPATVSNSVPSQFRSPYDPEGPGGSTISPEVTDWEQITYFTVGSPSPNAVPIDPDFGPGQVAILGFETTKTIFSMLWGSLDPYNVLAFYDADENLIRTFTGSDIVTAGGPGTISGLGAAFVTISDIGPFQFVYFGSNRAAFEFSNVVAAVPLPAGGILLLTALGGLGLAARRRKA